MNDPADAPKSAGFIPDINVQAFWYGFIPMQMIQERVMKRLIIHSISIEHAIHAW